MLSKIFIMKRKTYVIKYLIKHTEVDEITIRKDLHDFWKRYPDKGLDGIYGYIINGKWEYRDRKEIAKEVLYDVEKGGKEYSPPFTLRYWAAGQDKTNHLRRI
jgi:hypothetical protein